MSTINRNNLSVEEKQQLLTTLKRIKETGILMSYIMTPQKPTVLQWFSGKTLHKDGRISGTTAKYAVTNDLVTSVGQDETGRKKFYKLSAKGVNYIDVFIEVAERRAEATGIQAFTTKDLNSIKTDAFGLPVGGILIDVAPTPDTEVIEEAILVIPEDPHSEVIRRIGDALRGMDRKAILTIFEYGLVAWHDEVSRPARQAEEAMRRLQESDLLTHK